MLASLLTVLVSATASAGWLVEPVIGYQSGSTSRTTASTATPPDTNYSSTETSTLAGLKFGYIFGNRMTLGAEYAMLTGGKSKMDSTESDFTSADMYLNLGYDGGRWRAYFGYGFSSTVTYPATATSAEAKMPGTSIKVGAGFLAMNHLAIGFEYIMPTYTKFEQSGVSVNLSDIYSKFTTSSYNINISFPFVF